MKQIKPIEKKTSREYLKFSCDNKYGKRAYVDNYEKYRDLSHDTADNSFGYRLEDGFNMVNDNY